MARKNLIVLYGIGGLSDVGRHVIWDAIHPNNNHDDEIDQIMVITKHPELLYEQTNWDCGCPEPHQFTEQEQNERIKLISIDPDTSWNDVDLSSYIQNKDSSTTTIISCLGNRQPFIGHWDSYEGNLAVVRAIHTINDMKSCHKIQFRIVAITSCGINEDWPPLEFFTIGKIAMFIIFTVLARTMYHDLTNMENLYKKACVDENNVSYLLVRPVGITEDVLPINSWKIQTEKYKDPLGIEMAKLDVARFMIQEALYPTRYNTAVVIGSDPAVEIQRNTVKTTTSRDQVTTPSVPNFCS